MLVSLAITGIYSALSGLWGVVVTDFLQFIFAMGGTIALAWFALRAARDRRPRRAGRRRCPRGHAGLRARPVGRGGDGRALVALPLARFLTYVGVQWWASWYPGQEPGGGGYVAQRMMSAKDERHSLSATLWFTVAHYCLRPWPWILVGLASMVLYPDARRQGSGLRAGDARSSAGSGWRGLLLGAFFAAYMSTISTQLNWGTSYLVNDFYRRFVTPGATEAHYVWVSRDHDARC